MKRPALPAAIDGPLVVDANILFSALLRDGATRRLLLDGQLNVHTPSHIWSEFERNRAFLLKKSRATRSAFDILIDSLKDRLSDIPLPLIRDRMDEALEAVANDDREDSPYIAAALALGATLWTDDKRLADSAPVLVLTTSDVIRLRGIP